MSTMVDSRIVEMRFDNRHFENNVSTTMSTLDKLKQKLHLDGATKGLESVNSAARKVDMSGLGTAVESVQAKFSAMQVIGVTALANITNSAVNAGKRIVSALTIDPVKTGFQEYETQINATQTILANTKAKGSTIDDVNKALEELNAYADKTIYNFTEMTRNIGTFTAAGVDLETSVNAIQGIANLAAVSGSTSQQASTAMYQLSQALSSGTVKLQDWNSVVNAGMGGEMFQNALRETSEQLKTGAEAAIKAKGSFRESLRDGWLTSEVLTETLKKFTTSGANEYIAKYTGQSKETIETELRRAEATAEAAKAQGKEVDAIELAAEALAKKSNKSKEEIYNALDFARTAEDAATKVKTFTQLWDVLKESAQSGWSQSWKIIVGDFEAAKEFFTPLADFLTGVVNKMSDARNRVLEIALAFSKPWDVLKEKLSKITNTVSGVSEAVSGALKPLEYFQDVVDRVWMGDFNNWGDNPDRRDLLKAAGYDPRVVQYLVNLGEEAWHSGQVYKLSMEEVEAAHKKYGLTVQGTTEETKKVTDAFNGLDDELLKSAGLTDEEIRLYRALEQEAAKAGMSVGEFADKMAETDGRTLLIDSLKNFGDILVGVGKAAKEAWIEIFDPPSVEEIGIRLYGLINSLKEFSEKLRLTDKETGKLNDNGKKVKRTLEGVFAAVDIVLTVLGGPLKIIFKALIDLLSVFDLNLLDVTANIGDAVVAFRDWIDETLDFTKVFEKLAEPIKNAVKSFGEWIDSLKESENLPQDIADGIIKGFRKAVDAVKNFFKNIREGLTNGFSGLEESPLLGYIEAIKNGFGVAYDVVKILAKKLLAKVNEFLSARGFAEISEDSIAGFVNGLKEGASKVWNAGIEMVTNLVSKVCEFLGIHSPSTVFAAIGGFIVAGLIAGLQNGIPDSLGAIKDVFQPMLDWIKGLDFGTIFAGVLSLGIVRAVNQFADAFKGFSGIGETISEGIGGVLEATTKTITSFSGVLKSMSLENTAEAVKNFAIALAVLVAALALLAYVCGKEDFNVWEAVGVIAVLAVLLGGLAIGLNLLSKATADLDLKAGSFKISGITSGLISIAAALLLMSLTVKLISNLDPDKAKAGFYGLAALVVAIGAVLMACKFLVTGDVAGNMDKVGSMLLKISIAMLLMVGIAKLIAGMKWRDMGKAAAGMAGLVIIVTYLMFAVSLAGPNADKAGGTLLKISIAMAVLVWIGKMLVGMTWGEMGKAAAGMAGLVGIIIGLVTAVRIFGKDAPKIAGTLLALSVSMAILVAVGKMILSMSWEEMGKAGAGLAGLAAIISGIMFTISKAGPDAHKAGVAMVAIAAAIGLLAFVAVVLGTVEIKNLAKGIIVVGILSLLVAGMIGACKGVNGDIKDALTKLVVAIAVLTLAAVALSFVDPKKLSVATASLSALLLSFAVMTKSAKDLKVDIGPFLMMLGVVVILTAILWAISVLKIDNTLNAALSLSVLLIALSGALTILSKIKSCSLGAIIAVGMLSVVTALLGLVLAMMSALKVENAIPNAIALSILAGAMSVVMVPLSLIGSLAPLAMKGALALAVMAVPLIAFVGVLAVMQNVQNAMNNTLVLVTLATAMTLLLIPLTLIGIGGATALLGVLALTAMAVPLIAFVGVLAVMQHVEDAEANVKLLTSLLTTMTAVLVVLAVVGPLAYAGISALTTLSVFMLALAGLALAIRGLMVIVPDLQEFLATGIAVLEQLARGLGSIIGSFIAGFAGEVMTILPALGTCLSQFMTNLQPFIDGVKMVDERVLAGVGILTAAIIALTVADLINGMVTLSPCVGTLADLGTQLSMFMMNAMPFILGASMISEDMLSGVKALAETILILTAANVIEGLTSWLTGGSSLENFAAQLPVLGQGLAAFSSSLGTFADDQLATVNCAAQAVKTLASAAAEIPNTGGLLASIVGENDLGVFAAQFPVLGTGLSQFLTNIGTFTDDQVATVNCAAQAIKTLAQASSEIPNSGGWLGQIVGENDLGTFAAQFPALGTALAGFLTNVGIFTDDQVATVDCAAQAIKTLAQASSEIPNSGGWLGQIVGENDLGKFAAQFPALGTGLADFLTNVGTFNTDQVATVNCAADAIKSLASVASSIPNSGGIWAKIVGDNDLGDFASKFPKIGEGIKGFASNLGTFTSDQVATVNAGVRAIYAIAGLANADLSGANKNISGFGDKLPAFGSNIASFCTNMPGQMTMNLAVANLNSLLDAVEDISKANSGALSTFAENLKTVGEDAVKKFTGAFTSESAKTDLKSAGKKLGAAAVEGAESKKDGMTSAGKDLGSGLVQGINGKWYAVYNAAYKLGQAAVQGEKAGQQSNSPSKLTILAGKWLGEGLIIGMDKMGSKVYDAGHNLGDGVTKTLSTSISRISDMVNSDIDAQPTIRPVLDLTDVRTGANALNSMLDMNSSIGVRANVGAISSMMNDRSQNGVNADVVTAINKLRDKMDNLGNTTYQVNGVTYDDGSNVKDAVGSLVRAIRVERRV